MQEPALKLQAVDPVRLAAVDDQEETGWKYIHGDVFRFPPHLSLFCACVGTGSQILTMAVCIFALALVGVFYPYNRGALLTACVVSMLLFAPDTLNKLIWPRAGLQAMQVLTERWPANESPEGLCRCCTR